MGGQSAFGTKAGDLFTRITIVVAAIWVLLALASVKFLNLEGSRGGLNAADRGITLPAPKTELQAPTSKTPNDAESPSSDTEKAKSPPDTATPPAEKTAEPPAAPPPSSPPPAEAPAKAADDAKP
jgi:preprotein translocase subunit SecG